MPGSIYQLLYMSKASRPLSAADIASILGSARKYNPLNAVTGLLIARDGKFLQLLEGEKGDVQRTFERIKRDDRHSHLIKVLETSVNKRLFATWSMAYGEELVTGDTAVTLFSSLDRAMLKSQLDQKVIMSILEHFANNTKP